MDFVDAVTKILNEDVKQFKASASLDVHVEVDGVLHDGPGKVTVPFDTDFEFRSWGVKSINVLVGGRQVVVMSFFKGEERFEKEVTLDFDSAEIDVGGHLDDGITITSLYVVLDKDFNQKELLVRVSE